MICLLSPIIINKLICYCHLTKTIKKLIWKKLFIILVIITFKVFIKINNNPFKEKENKLAI